MQFGFHLTSHGVISYVSLVMVLCGGGHISQTYFVSGPRFVWTPLRQSRRSKCPRVKIHLFVFVCFRVDKIWSAASPAPHLGSNLHSAGVPPPAGGEGGYILIRSSHSCHAGTRTLENDWQRAGRAASSSTSGRHRPVTCPCRHRAAATAPAFYHATHSTLSMAFRRAQYHVEFSQG